MSSQKERREPPPIPEPVGRLIDAHTHLDACGAVDAAVKVVKDQAVLPGHLPELVAQIEPAVERAAKMSSGSLLANACEENVRGQVAALKKASPIVAESYAAGKIDIVGAIYDLPSGRVKPV